MRYKQNIFIVIVLFIQYNLLLLQYTCYSDSKVIQIPDPVHFVVLPLVPVLKLFGWSECLRKSILSTLISILEIKKSRTESNQVNMADD